MSAYSLRSAAQMIKSLANTLGCDRIILGGHDWVRKVCWIDRDFRSDMRSKGGDHCLQSSTRQSFLGLFVRPLPCVRALTVRVLLILMPIVVPGAGSIHFHNMHALLSTHEVLHQYRRPCD